MNHFDLVKKIDGIYDTISVYLNLSFFYLMQLAYKKYTQKRQH